jgi:hypothetical protein
MKRKTRRQKSLASLLQELDKADLKEEPLSASK